MKLYMKWSLLIFFILGSFKLSAQPGTISSHLENSHLVRDLSGYSWKLKMMNPGQGEKEGLQDLPPEDIETLVWNPAHVPGDVYTDLWKAGIIDDPYFGRNSTKAQWVMYKEWWYSTQFNVAEDLEDKMVYLNFEGVDFSCDVWLNGTYLGSHEGAFSPFSFDITNAVRASTSYLHNKNMLIIKINPPPQVNNKVVGLKTPWFGDYWRDLVPFGIYRPVSIVATGAIKIDDLYTKSKINEDGSADVTLEVTVNNTSTETRSVNFEATLQGSNFEGEPHSLEIERTIKPGIQTIKESIHIDKPKLWFPWDLGDPNLYSANVNILEKKSLHDHAETTFGIREVTMQWNPGFSRETEVSFPRTVLINGKYHYIRSACWGGPPDIFFGRTSHEEYKKLIQLAKDANMNNIRIFGWHPPEIPEFYKLCNEAGLTVWQDVIPLGTGNISQDPAFLDRVIEEAVAVIKVRRNNPCLILVEGGEEAFFRTSDPPFMNKFLIRLGDSITKYCGLPYVPDSPLTDHVAQSVGYKKKEAVHALAYFYGMGRWPMEDYFPTLDYPIVPELAITSVPNVESLKKFIPENEMWPPGLSWGHHWADLDRLRIQNYDAFDDERTGSLEEFVNATQDAQGIIFQYAIEHFRRQKPRVSGIALCHFITYWPDMKWGFVDNYQQPKRSYNYVQTAYQPLLVNLQYDKRRWKNDEDFKAQIWVVNDAYTEYRDAIVQMKLTNKAGKVLKEEKFELDMLEGNSSKKFFDIKWDVLKNVENNFYVDLTLLDKDGKQISSNNYMLLIGDKEASAAKFKQMGEEIRERNGQYSYGNYYRFFPDMINKDGKSYQTQETIPRARGFEE